MRAAVDRRSVVVGAALAVLSLAGCKPGMLPDSSVEATPQNRELAGVVEKYRKALEGKNVNAVINLCSPDYIEDLGTTDPADDYDLDGLRTRLTEDMARVQTMRVTVRLLRMEADGDRAYVDYRFQIRSLVSLPAGEQWYTKTDDNRLSFQKRRGRWEIVSGL